MLDRVLIEKITGRTGQMIDDVLKISIPRIDLRVTLDGFQIVPFMGLTSWIAFRKGPEHVTLMGDLVLLEDEIEAAMTSAIESGLYVTALHNHFTREQPRVMFMHIEATADAATLASGVRRALDRIDRVRGQNPLPAGGESVASRLDQGALEDLVGAKAEVKNGVTKFVLGRPEVPLRCMRCGDLEINSAMGYNTWAAFQGTEARAAVCGDFAALELEVAPVIDALRKGGIEVVAIHNHMFFEDPRMIFMHYWGVGAAGALARTLRKALDSQNGAVKTPCCAS